MKSTTKIGTALLLAAGVTLSAAVPSSAAVRRYPYNSAQGLWAADIKSPTQASCRSERATVVRGAGLSGWTVTIADDCWYDRAGKHWRTTVVYDTTP